MRELGINAKCSVQNDVLETRSSRNLGGNCKSLDRKPQRKVFFINMVTQEAKMEARDSMMKSKPTSLVFSYSIPLLFTPAQSSMDFGI